MDFTGYLQDLRRAKFYEDQIEHVERIPARTAEYGEVHLSPLIAQHLLDCLNVQNGHEARL